jgi:RNA polymerase-binding transcription factor DksA
VADQNSKDAQPKEPWREVHEAFLKALHSLANDHDTFRQALAAGSIDDVANALLARACQSFNIEPGAYVAALQAHADVRRQLDEAVGALLQHPLLLEAQRGTVLEEMRQQMLLLEFALSGEEPPAHAWNGIDPDEQIRLRATAAGMRGTDPDLLIRTRHALSKAGPAFGQCESCGQPIALGRLRLIPQAERCTSCQIKHEGPPPPREGPPLVTVTQFAGH